VDIEVIVMHETEKAWLLNDGTKEAWVPKSQVTLDFSQTEGEDGYGIATMQEQLAIDKGFA
jgi:RNase P/RNase MRP subunit p29